MSDKEEMDVEFALLCDDIRQEVNGKFLFVGTYTGGVDFHFSPYHGFFQLATFMKFSKPGKFNSIVSVHYNGKEIASLSGEMNVEGNLKVFSQIPIELKDITQDGVLEVFMGIDGTSLQKAFSCPFTFRAASSS